MESEASKNINLCRLCSSQEELIWLFDSRILGPAVLKEAVFITTNVLIEKSDQTTQKICKKCCMLVIRMLKFRENCIVNDKKLKLQCGQKLDAVVQNIKEEIVPLKNEAVEKSLLIPDKKQAREEDKSMAHESVRKIFEVHSNVQFSKSLWKLNLTPSIVVNKKEVTEWFEKHPATDIIEEKETELTTAPVAGNKRKLSTSSVESSSVDQPPPKRKSSIEASSKIAIIGQVQQSELLLHSQLFSNKMDQDVLICKICNSVHYNEHTLKMHMRKHLNCQFCKVRLKTLEEKDHHLEKECPIKSIMLNLPNLCLVPVDQDPEIIRRFPKTFQKTKAEENFPSNECEVYYISDDEDLTVTNEESFSSSTPSKDSGISVTSNTSEIPNKPTNLVPKLKILQNPLFDSINFNSTDYEVMKNLLRASNPKSRSIPQNKDISIRGTNDKIYILKNILPHLHMYKIPVDIEYNTKLTISYDSYMPPHKSNKNELWSDLTPSIMLMPGNYTSFQKANINKPDALNKMLVPQSQKTCSPPPAVQQINRPPAPYIQPSNITNTIRGVKKAKMQTPHPRSVVKTCAPVQTSQSPTTLLNYTMANQRMVVPTSNASTTGHFVRPLPKLVPVPASTFQNLLSSNQEVAAQHVPVQLPDKPLIRVKPVWQLT